MNRLDLREALVAFERADDWRFENDLLEHWTAQESLPEHGKILHVQNRTVMPSFAREVMAVHYNENT